MNSHDGDQSDAFRRLDDLLQRYFDHEITGDECRELLALWDAHPDCETRIARNYKAEQLLRFAAAVRKNDFLPTVEVATSRRPRETELEQWARYEREAAKSVDPMESFADTFHADSHAKPQRQRKSAPPKSAPPKPAPQKGSLLLALVVAGLIIVAVYHEFKPTPGKQATTFRAMGHVSASVDVRWPEGVEALKPGQGVATDRIRFDDGLLELRLKNGVRLALEGPVDFKVNSAMNTFCGRGRVSVSVPPEGKGFTVSTPFNDVIDLGTEFHLRVEEDRVETHTIQGLVTLGKLPNDLPKKLPGGHAFSIDTSGKMRDFTAERSLFADEQTVQKQFTAVQQREMSAWEKRIATLRNDPGLILLFDFEENGRPDDKSVVNQARGAKACGDGSRSGTRPAEGRWKGKGAVAFQSKRDAVGIRVPGELQSVTLLASIRAETLDRFAHCLLAGNEESRGTLIWQLGGDGVLTLAVQNGPNVPAVAYPSAPLLSPNRLGAWYQLATVVDAEAGTVTHYLDDKQISTLPIRQAQPIRIGDARIGNGIRHVRTPVDRSFNGRIDAFLIFDRALGAAEIAAFFNTSLPE